jgi:hypothetical protein
MMSVPPDMPMCTFCKIREGLPLDSAVWRRWVPPTVRSTSPSPEQLTDVQQELLHE